MFNFRNFLNTLSRPSSLYSCFDHFLGCCSQIVSQSQCSKAVNPFAGKIDPGEVQFLTAVVERKAVMVIVETLTIGKEVHSQTLGWLNVLIVRPNGRHFVV